MPDEVKIDPPKDPATTTDPPKVVPPVAIVPPTPQAASSATTEEGKKKFRLTDDDEDLPQGAELFEISAKALDSRLQRASQKEIKKLFDSMGVKDHDELQAKLAAAKAKEEEDEAKRLATLTNEQKLQEERDRYQRERDEWKTKFESAEEQKLIGEAHTRVADIAKKLLDSDYLEDELPRFGRYLAKTYSPEQIDALDDATIEKYFTDRIVEKPKLGKDFGAAPPTPPVLLQRPLTTGPKENMRPTPKKIQVGQRSFSPRADNPMSREEAKAEARKLGFDY